MLSGILIVPRKRDARGSEWTSLQALARFGLFNMTHESHCKHSAAERFFASRS